jgi:hypothetical protein
MQSATIGIESQAGHHAAAAARLRRAGIVSEPRAGQREGKALSAGAPAPSPRQAKLNQSSLDRDHRVTPKYR